MQRHIFKNYHIIDCYSSLEASLNDWHKLIGNEALNKITPQVQMGVDALVVKELRSNILNTSDLINPFTGIYVLMLPLLLSMLFRHGFQLSLPALLMPLPHSFLRALDLPLSVRL